MRNQHQLNGIVDHRRCGAHPIPQFVTDERRNGTNASKESDFEIGSIEATSSGLWLAQRADVIAGSGAGILIERATQFDLSAGAGHAPGSAGERDQRREALIGAEIERTGVSTEQQVAALDRNLTLAREEKDAGHSARIHERRHREVVGALNAAPHAARRTEWCGAFRRQHLVRLEVAGHGLAGLIGEGRRAHA